MGEYWWLLPRIHYIYIYIYMQNTMIALRYHANNSDSSFIVTQTQPIKVNFVLWAHLFFEPANWSRHETGQFVSIHLQSYSLNSLRPSDTYKCVGNLTIIGSDNGLSPGRPQAIIWTNAGILLIRNLGTNFSEILSKIRAFSLKKMHLKMLSAKWRPFCLGLNVLTHWSINKMAEHLQTVCLKAFL